MNLSGKINKMTCFQTGQCSAYLCKAGRVPVEPKSDEGWNSWRRCRLRSHETLHRKVMVPMTMQKCQSCLNWCNDLTFGALITNCWEKIEEAAAAVALCCHEFDQLKGNQQDRGSQEMFEHLWDVDALYVRLLRLFLKPWWDDYRVTSTQRQVVAANPVSALIRPIMLWNSTKAKVSVFSSVRYQGSLISASSRFSFGMLLIAIHKTSI
jgi:hypothetical protein